MSDSEEFASVRAEPDALRRGRRATELLTLYQQRSTELARLRRAAIEQARDETGMSYTEIAAALGITKGRVTQIRGSAPTQERAFFGVGPVTIGVPYRYQTTDRERPLIAAEDAQAGESATQLLHALGFATTSMQIEPDMRELPEGDALVICGPKSAPIAATLLDRDPVLAVVNHGGRWWIEDRETGIRHGSPSDEPEPLDADIAYVARHVIDGRVIVHVAGLHAIGSLGALHYLTANVAELFTTADTSLSLIVRANYTGLEIDATELLAGPKTW
ncbi:helix-turn-helix domain-containing protein [Knoellia locipacati]|uniref:helix-turn-helix domain-containing protein n=1 Tax=Knoellia locipacati TaxID=882824 RepID=UPI00384E50D3